MTLIETPRTSLATILGRCDYCQKGTRVTKCYFDQTSVCGYHRLLNYVYPTSCVQLTKRENSVPQRQSIPEEKGDEKTQDVLKSDPEQGKDKQLVKEDNNVDSSSRIPVEKSSVVTEAPIDPTPALSKDISDSQSQTQRDIKPSSSQNVSPSMASEKQELPKATADPKLVDSPKQDSQDQDVLKESSTDFDNCVQKGGTIISGVKGSSCTMGPESLDVRPVVRDESVQIPTESFVPTETKPDIQPEVVQQQQQEVKKQQIPPIAHAQQQNQQQGSPQQQQQAQQNQQQVINYFLRLGIQHPFKLHITLLTKLIVDRVSRRFQGPSPVLR